MKPIWLKRALKFVVFALIIIAGFGQAILQLWNWLMPALFGLPTLHFWQAVGLLALSRILFGKLGGFGGGPHWRHRMGRRWEQMPPEEREKFAQGMRDRCGPGKVSTTV